jgi:hypothetical protein
VDWIRKAGTGETEDGDFSCVSTGYVSLSFFGGTVVSDCILGLLDSGRSQARHRLRSRRRRGLRCFDRIANVGFGRAYINPPADVVSKVLMPAADELLNCTVPPEVDENVSSCAELFVTPAPRNSMLFPKAVVAMVYPCAPELKTTAFGVT